MENLYALGLVAIAVGWLVQFLSTSHKDREFQPLFLVFYALGTGILAWISYQSGSPLTAILNLASFVLPIAILMRISK
jgi:hypothetical protein